MFVKPGTEIRFTSLLLSNIHDKSSAQDAWDVLFENIQENAQNPHDLLGEMQFAFVCFLCGHLYEGFEQWKKIVRFLCSTKRSLTKHEDFYTKFVICLYFQLKLTPAEFFVDIVSKSNFLTVTLTNFFTNVECNVDAKTQLAERARKFKAYLKKQFKWDFDTVLNDDEPVVVVATWIIIMLIFLIKVEQFW